MYLENLQKTNEKVENYGVGLLPGNINHHITVFYHSGVDQQDQNKLFLFMNHLIRWITIKLGFSFTTEAIGI